MGKPLINEKYEEYVNDILVKPYTQYIQKFGLLKLRHICRKIKGSKDDSDHSMWFIQLNLIKFALKELEAPCR